MAPSYGYCIPADIWSCDYHNQYMAGCQPYFAILWWPFMAIIWVPILEILMLKFFQWQWLRANDILGRLHDSVYMRHVSVRASNLQTWCWPTHLLDTSRCFWLNYAVETAMTIWIYLVVSGCQLVCPLLLMKLVFGNQDVMVHTTEIHTMELCYVLHGTLSCFLIHSDNLQPSNNC